MNQLLIYWNPNVVVNHLQIKVLFILLQIQVYPYIKVAGCVSMCLSVSKYPKGPYYISYAGTQIISQLDRLTIQKKKDRQIILVYTKFIQLGIQIDSLMYTQISQHLKLQFSLSSQIQVYKQIIGYLDRQTLSQIVLIIPIHSKSRNKQTEHRLMSSN